jgi:hypothetical protein
MNLYCFGGLGVDDLSFVNFCPNNYDLKIVKWITPTKKESIDQYSIRLYKQLNITGKFCLLGVSFGGIVAQEIAKCHSPERLFLISAFVTKSEITLHLKFALKLKLHRIIPSIILKKSNFITFWLFGIEKVEDEKLLSKIVKATDVYFLKWAISEIAAWKGDLKLDSIRFHGEKDRIIPCPDVVQHKVQKAGHFMIYTHGIELTGILEKSQPISE